MATARGSVNKITKPITVMGCGIGTSIPVTGRLALSPGQANAFAKRKKPFVYLRQMTEPKDVPIMKKAEAILTTGGGPSCHAAIVSRAMGKPCITSLSMALYGTVYCSIYDSLYRETQIKAGISVTVHGDRAIFEVQDD